MPSFATSEVREPRPQVYGPVGSALDRRHLIRRLGLYGQLIVEQLGNIERIADSDFTTRSSICPHLEVRERCLTSDDGNGAVDSVLTAREHDAADARLMETRVDRHSMAADIHFGVRVKIHVIVWIGKSVF